MLLSVNEKTELNLTRFIAVLYMEFCPSLRALSFSGLS